MSPKAKTPEAVEEFLAYLRRVGGLTETMRFDDLRDVEWAIKRVQGWLAPAEKPGDVWPVWYGEKRVKSQNKDARVGLVTLWDVCGIPELLTFHREALFEYLRFQRYLVPSDEEEEENWPGGEFSHVVVGRTINKLLTQIKTTVSQFRAFENLVHALPRNLDSASMGKSAKALQEYSLRVKNLVVGEHNEYRVFLEVAGRTNTGATQDFLREAAGVLSCIHQHILRKDHELAARLISYYNTHVAQHPGVLQLWEGWLGDRQEHAIWKKGVTYKFPYAPETGTNTPEPAPEEPADGTHVRERKPEPVNEELDETALAWRRTCRGLLLMEDYVTCNNGRTLRDISDSLWGLILPLSPRREGPATMYHRAEMGKAILDYENCLAAPTYAPVAREYKAPLPVKNSVRTAVRLLDQMDDTLQDFSRGLPGKQSAARYPLFREGSLYVQTNKARIRSFCNAHNVRDSVLADSLDL